MARPARPERSRSARSSRQLSRFYHSINLDRVFGTHRSSSAFLVVVMMATMLDNDHAPRAMITPVSIMVSVAPHFDTHTAVVTITISVHFASVAITVIAITSDADAKLFGACDGGSSNRNSS